MSNDESMTNSQMTNESQAFFGTWTLDIRSLIRHSSFDIPLEPPLSRRADAGIASDRVLDAPPRVGYRESRSIRNRRTLLSTEDADDYHGIERLPRAAARAAAAAHGGRVAFGGRGAE